MISAPNGITRLINISLYLADSFLKAEKTKGFFDQEIK